MPDHYHDANDVKLMREMRKLAAALKAGAAPTHGAMALKFFDLAE